MIKYYFLSILILFLSISSKVFAEDDITDIQIAGISIGDSLLDYFDKDLIELEKYDKHSLFYKNNEYVQIGASHKDAYRLKVNSDRYDDLSIVLKTNDNNYEVFLIGGRIFCNDINLCKNKKEKIVNDLTNFFSKDIQITNENRLHRADPKGNSKIYETYFKFKESSGYVSVSIYDWTDEDINGLKYTDNLKVSIFSEEFDNFLSEIEYN